MAEDEVVAPVVVDDDDEAIEGAPPDGPLAAVNAPPPWERQPGETPKQFHAFTHYRDLTLQRSIRRAFTTHKLECQQIEVNPVWPPKRWLIWSAQWGWVDRANVWDAECDRQSRARVIQNQYEARERHSRLARATLTALTIPINAQLQAIQDDPTILNMLAEQAKSNPASAMQLLSAIARVAQVIPFMINAERQALGLTTETVEVEDKRDDTLASRIAADPDATDMAIALLDRLAHPRKSLTVGSGPLCDEASGTVGAESSPQLSDQETG